MYLDLIRPVKEMLNDAAGLGKIKNDHIHSIPKTLRCNGHPYQIAHMGTTAELPDMGHVL